jgi:RNA polymerase sigma-54 factor
MDLKPEINLKQKQTLFMSPALQQAIKLLQLSNLELSQKIEEEILDNPALEIEDSPESNAQELSEEELYRRAGEGNEADGGDEFDEGAIYDEFSLPQSSRGGDEDRKREFIEGTLSRDRTLHEYLLQQVHLLKIEKEKVDIAEILINCIDEDGYLSSELEEISGNFNVPVEDLEDTLKIIQGLDPTGVGARTIQECLLIQLKDRPGIPRGVASLAERIVSDFLNEVKLKKFDEIARKIGVSREKLDQILKVISRLEPYPGRQFYTEEIKYIIPDVIVVEGEDGFEVLPNNYIIPRLRVRRDFEELLRKRSLSKREKDFLRKGVQRAKSFIYSIDQRESTLVRVMNAIIDRQRDFFLRGPLHLKPMTLKDIAEMLGLHESTISRITTSKYVQTSYGVFRLKYFFSNALSTDGYSEVSSTTVKEQIKEIIQNEGSAGEPPGKSPGQKSQRPRSREQLSDQKIADILKERGIPISRRTVAKYRKDLHILPSNLRR